MNKQNNTPRPVRTGKPPISLTLTGYVLPHLGSASPHEFIPVLLEFDPATVYVPLFSTIEKLRVYMHQIGVSYLGVKQIDDAREFLREFPHKIGGRSLVLICDPIQTTDGKVRFTAILRD